MNDPTCTSNWAELTVLRGFCQCWPKPMRQLTSLDAQFLALETPRIFGHVTGVLVLDPSTAPGGTLTLTNLQDLIMERLPLIPIFKWRLAEVPFGLDFAYWVDDPDFDIDFHVRELALVPPGTTAQLEEQVARIFSRPLDRSRPLWEIYLIHGLENGRVALMTKVHHAVIDGLSGAEILGSLLDLTPEGRAAPDPVFPGLHHMPSQLEMLARGLIGVPQYPLRLLRSLPAALPHFEEVGIFSILPGAQLSSGLPDGGCRRHCPGIRSSAAASSRLPRTPPSTAGSPRTGASSSARSLLMLSKMSRTCTESPSTTSWSRYVPAPCAAGCRNTTNWATTR